MIQSRKRRALHTLNLAKEKALATNTPLPPPDLSHVPPAVQQSLKANGHKYFCQKCNIGFRKQKNLQEHLDGRKHERVVSEWESAARDYRIEAPSWGRRVQPQVRRSMPAMDGITADSGGHGVEQIDANGSNAKTSNGTDIGADGDFDADIDVRTCWTTAELKDFPHRSSCIDHSLILSTLSPQHRARFWRYLRDSFGQHYPEMAAIFHHVSVTHPQYLRVKELFENLEAFQIVSSVIITAQDAARDGGGTADGEHPQATIDTIFDLACGHGVLGILLAYRFPTKKVICVDLEQRQSFYAFRDAFVAQGEPYNDEPILSNLEYREADLRTIAHDPALSPSACLVAVHACNEANKHVVELARGAGAAWAVMPCCIRARLYLGGAPVLGLDGETRYKLLCGAFAEANAAKVIRTIPRDITARPILIAGGFEAKGGDDSDDEGGDNGPHQYDQDHGSDNTAHGNRDGFVRAKR